MTRLPFAVIAASLFSIAGGAFAATRFSDVPSTYWAAVPIAWVIDNGIMTGQGTPATAFDPGGTVNRAQLAAILTRVNHLYQQRLDAQDLRIAQLEEEIATMKEQWE